MKRLRSGSGSAMGLMPMDCAMAAARVPRSDSSRPPILRIFSGDEQEENRALHFFRMRFEAGGDVHGEGTAGAVVHGAVVDAIAVDGRADADVVDVRGEDDEFIF